MDEFCADHEAKAADITDDRVPFLQFGETGAKLLSTLCSIFAKAMFLDIV